MLFKLGICGHSEAETQDRNAVKFGDEANDGFWQLYSCI